MKTNDLHLPQKLCLKNTFAFAFILLSFIGKATTYTALTNGNWDDDATWSGVGIPGAADDVVIEDGKTITVNISNAACNSLSLGTGGLLTAACTLSFSSPTSQLTTGSIQFGALLSTCTLDMSNGGTISSSDWTVSNANFIYGTGTVKFTGTFTLPNDTNFNTFYNLEILSGTTTLSRSTSILNDITMSGTGILNASTQSLAVGGNWTQSGTASFTEGTQTVTFNGSGDQYINHTSTETFYNLIVNKPAGAFYLSTGNISITSLMTISSSGVVDLGTNTLDGPGGLTMLNGDLQIGQLSSVCGCTLPSLTGTYTISGGSVTFKGAGAQTIRGETVSSPVVPEYQTLILKGLGVKSLEGNLNVNQSIYISENAELDVTTANREITVTGNWVNTSTANTPDAFNERNGKVTFDGISTLTLTSTSVPAGETFYDLTMNKTASTDNLFLNNNVTVTNQLTLTSGHILTSSASLTLDTAALAVSGTNNNSFVDGPIIKKTNSTVPFVLPVGKINPNNEYRPLKLTPAGTSATTYIAEYLYGPPINNTDVGPGVDHVSELESWTVERNSGIEDAKIELSWNANSVVTDNTTDLLVVQDNGTGGPRWIDRCTCTTAGSTTSGTIETSNYVSLFGNSYPFSLASPNAINNELGNSRYSVADGDWSNTSTWATRSGGPAGASVPTNTKRVFIEAGKRVDVDVDADALKLTLGNNGFGILDFNATTNDVTVGSEGVIINFGSDVEGTNTSAILRTSGDLAINADISVESSDNTSASNFIVMRETTGSKYWSGTGTITNFANNATTTLTGTATVKLSLAGTAHITNAGSLTLNGSGATITANLVDNTTITPNTMEFNNTLPNFDFTAKSANYFNLILSGASTKRPSSAWTVNGNLTLNAGMTLDQNTNDNDIIVKGDWVNNGATFLPSTTSTCEVTLSGSSEQNVTSNGNAFGNLIINNSSSTGVVLQDDMQIDDGRKLTLTDGYLFLGNHNVTLLGTNVNPAGASNGSFVVTNGTGKLRIEAITGSRTFPVGSSGNIYDYTPVTIDNTGGTSDRYDVSVCANIYMDGNCSGGTLITSKCINKTWDISEAVAGGSSVDLTLQWNGSHELSGFDKYSSFISHYTGGKWVQQQPYATASGSDPYTRTATDLSSFSPYGVGSASSPLPIELLNFNAELVENTVVLDWATASETNNDYFIIERSADGKSFTPINQLKGAGNSIQKLAYTITDASPLTGVSYYRIKQVDFNGDYSFSNVKSISYLNGNLPVNHAAFVVYPNPTENSAQLFFPNMKSEQVVNLMVYDISGKLVHAGTVTLHEQQQKIQLPENMLPGAYFIVCNSGDQMHKQKLIVIKEK